jgi:hypothetical protein
MRWNAIRETVGTSVMVAAVTLSIVTSALAAGWPGTVLLLAAGANALVGAGALLRRRMRRRPAAPLPASTTP